METNNIIKVGDICVLTHNHDIIFDFESTNEFGFPTSKRVCTPTLSDDFEHTMYTFEVFDKPHYFDLVRQISMFKATIEKAANEYAPSIIAKYLLNLAQSFNKFYSMEKINVEEDKVRNSNFALAKATRIVLNEGLRLLGIHFLEEM